MCVVGPLCSKRAFQKSCLVLIIPNGAVRAGCEDCGYGIAGKSWSKFECLVGILANRNMVSGFWKYLGGLLGHEAVATE